MRRIAAAAVLAAMMMMGLAPAAGAASVCYSASVTVNGDAVVDEAACLP